MSNRKKIIYLAATIVSVIGLVFLLSMQKRDDTSAVSSEDAIVAAESRAASEGAESTPTQAVPVESFKPGDKVNFTLKTNKGTVSSEDFLGKPLMLEFIATWCPYCQKTTPNIKKALSRKPIPFVMVGAADESEEAVIGFHKNYDLPGPVGFDPGLKLIRRFGGSGYPTLVYINRDGRLVASSSGEAGVSEIIANIRRAGS